MIKSTNHFNIKYTSTCYKYKCLCWAEDVHVNSPLPAPFWFHFLPKFQK